MRAVQILDGDWWALVVERASFACWSAHFASDLADFSILSVELSCTMLLLASNELLAIERVGRNRIDRFSGILLS